MAYFPQTKYEPGDDVWLMSSHVVNGQVSLRGPFTVERVTAELNAPGGDWQVQLWLLGMAEPVDESRLIEHSYTALSKIGWKLWRMIDTFRNEQQADAEEVAS